MNSVKRYVVFFMMSAIFVVFSVGAALAAEEKVGGIEPQKVLFQHPKYEQVLKQIKAIAEKKQNEAKAAIDKESDNNKKSQIFSNMRKDIAEEEQKLMQPLFKEIDIAVRTVANAKKITVVVDKTAIFYGGVDITEDVIQELKKKSAGSK